MYRRLLDSLIRLRASLVKTRKKPVKLRKRIRHARGVCIDALQFRSCTDLWEAKFNYAGSVYRGPGEDLLVIIPRNCRDQLGIINNARLERALYNH